MSNPSIRTLSRAEILADLERLGIDPSRALGQNFVADPQTIRTIVSAAGVKPGDPVIEVGPGLGSLTIALASLGCEVLAVEKDRFVLKALRQRLDSAGIENVTIVHEDVLEVGWPKLLGDRSWSLVANLPYNIATGLVVDLLRDVPQIDRMLVMVQLEVAERLAAPLGTRAVGIPTIRAAVHADASIVATIGPEVFIPEPRVTSALLSMTRVPRRTQSTDAQLDRILAAGFGQRRKMLRRSLASVLNEQAIEGAGVDPTDRPERLSLAQWDALALAVGRTPAS